MTATITVTLEYDGEDYEVIDDQHQIRDAVYSKINELKQNSNFPENFCLKRYLKKQDNYVTTDLRILKNGDRILLSQKKANLPQDMETPKGKKFSSSTVKSKIEEVKKKLKKNEDLTEAERSFICEQLDFVSDECLAPGSKKRKSDMSYNISSAHQYLNDAYKLKPEDRDLEKIRHFSDMTFQHRRTNFLSNKPPNAKTAKQLYPFLFNLEQAFLEFEHITGKSDRYCQFLDGVQKFSTSILRYTEKSPFKSQILQRIENENNEGLKLRMKQIASLLILPSYFHDDRRGIIVFKNEKVPDDHNDRPFIECKDSYVECLKETTEFIIHVDNIVFCTTVNVFEAYFILIATYYIFNAVYPETCANTCEFLERYYTQFSDDSGASYEFTEDNEQKIKLLIKYSKKSERKNSDSS